MKKIVTLTAVGTILMSSNALASGFNLREQSVSGMGNAFAGATAGAEDISYSYFNPAGLTRHKGKQINVNATYVAPRSKAKGAHAELPPMNMGGSDDTPYSDNIVQGAVLPAMYASYQVNEDWTIGISSNTPFGMTTKYDDDWAGRYHGTLSKLMTETITPMAAYKVNEHLSLGAGLQIQYIKARLRNASYTAAYPGGVVDDKAVLNGDATDIGYTLGALYEFTPQTRFGIGYRSAIRHKLKGDIDFSNYNALAQDINARLTTPANLGIGAYHDINDQWAIMAEFGQTYWSKFKNLTIYGDSINSPSSGWLSNTKERWKDTTFYSFGVTYKADEQWKIRGGIGADQSAVGDRYRTPRIPDGDRIWYSAGLEYKYDDNWNFNAGYTYIRAQKGRVNIKGTDPDDAGRGSLSAKYESDIHIVGLGLNYNF